MKTFIFVVLLWGIVFCVSGDTIECNTVKECLEDFMHYANHAEMFSKGMLSDSPSRMLEVWNHKVKHAENMIQILTHVLVHTPLFNETMKEEVVESPLELNENQLEYLSKMKYLHDLMRLSYQIKALDQTDEIFKTIKKVSEKLVLCCATHKLVVWMNKDWLANQIHEHHSNSKKGSSV